MDLIKGGLKEFRRSSPDHSCFWQERPYDGDKPPYANGYLRVWFECLSCGWNEVGIRLPYWNMEKVEEHNRQQTQKGPNPWQE